jgi:hypothetical protein
MIASIKIKAIRRPKDSHRCARERTIRSDIQWRAGNDAVGVG